MSADVTAALQGAAQALHSSARSHKEAEFRHRKQARALRRQLDELRQTLAVYGITLAESIDASPPSDVDEHGASRDHAR